MSYEQEAGRAVRIQWTTAPHSTNANSRVADVAGHRLYVKRAAPRVRSFVASIEAHYRRGMQRMR